MVRKRVNASLYRSSGAFSLVVGGTHTAPPSKINSSRKRIKRFAASRLQNRTPAESAFEALLLSLGNGALRGKYIKEWIFHKWIIDFYLFEVRVAIEIDGGYHNSSKRIRKDIEKDTACRNSGITLIRIKNDEVFGDHEPLIQKLREAYRAGLILSRKAPVHKRYL
jgi:very-short-patch-repair endonuclease